MDFQSRKTGDFTTSTQIIKLSAAGLIVGAMCAFIAIVLLKMIYFFTNLSFYHRLSLAYMTPTHNHLHAWAILPPIVGAILIGFIARYGSEKIRGHGIPEAIEAMLVHESKVQPRVAFWKPISAAISIGSGGPFGAEGPIIMTGGSFGSLFSQFLKFSSVERRIMLVAGAAGGMSATFAAPVSSVLFAVELLVFEFKPRSLVPIALASAVADAIRVALIGPGPLFGMPVLTNVSAQLLGVSALIGVVGSFLAILLTWAIYGVEDAFRKLPIHWMWWPALGAVVIGVGGFISPRALGVGYDSISAMLNVKLTVYTLLTLLIVKTIIWVVALGSGTSGGILAPILIIGGSLGGSVGELFHVPHPGVWALLGMSAIFSGVTRTPFTSVIFPLELTHNLGALLPLLITSSIATGLSSFLLPRSILTEKIARRGLHLTREYQTDPLQMHYCKEIAWRPELSLSDDRVVRYAAEDFLAAHSSGTWLQVIDQDGSLKGIISAWELAKQSKLSPHSRILDHVGHHPVLKTTDTAKTALECMIEADADWVWIVDEQATCFGFVTLQQLFDLRKREYHEEVVRKRVFTWLKVPRREAVENNGNASRQSNM
ncbi:chloride channel protein [Alicyclobacillus tolerans]|uniref:chloride channel protein n=1 Tax=Alicyclobacillus tolerans TaxID=90970 RepID=UPI001F2FB259|nr:chloride channel protein [Alicyclobacillus tolerans]MCF8567523.1 chloride channel protein [Alicyclobacillus tolerans]